MLFIAGALHILITTTTIEKTEQIMHPWKLKLVIVSKNINYHYYLYIFIIDSL